MGSSTIRNFSIIAHIDHGKTTLSDRFLQMTHAVSEREMGSQMLDDMDLERERGITIKARAVTLRYRARDGRDYTFNLIDTPGHVDFSYEVSRSLQACDGAILVVDATQGVEAQTLANAHQAMNLDLRMVPVVNKIDMSLAEPERTMDQLEDLLAIDRRECLLVSAKAGLGVPELLEAVVERIPAPGGDPEAPLRALIFDSWYDTYRGVIVLIRVVDGSIGKGMKVRFLATKSDYEVEEVGIFSPKIVAAPRLGAGEVGYLICNIKKIGETKIGDTVTDLGRPAAEPLPGFKEVKPMVFAGLYPADAEDYTGLREAIEKLVLNDSALQFQPETSAALGFGFRCGFLGLLHMEIVQERLEREYNLNLITTAPTVKYRVLKSSGEVVEVESPKDLPQPQEIEAIEEPFIEITILTRDEYVGPILKILEEKRSTQKKFEYIGPGRVMLVYDMPLNEMVLDFHDRLKSASKGYASMDYTFLGHREGDLVKMDILVNTEPVDALSLIVPRERAYIRGKALVAKMRELIPRQMFEVAIQAAIGSRVIARESVKALRKNVLAKCYGGDITRKRKLLEKQKEGKRRMKKVGRVDIPQDAFLALLKVES